MKRLKKPRCELKYHHCPCIVLYSYRIWVSTAIRWKIRVPTTAIMALGTLSSIGKNLIDFSVANSLGAPLNTRSAACRCPFQSARRTVSFCVLLCPFVPFCALNRGLQFWDTLQQAGCIHVVLFPKKKRGWTPHSALASLLYEFLDFMTILPDYT